MARGRNTPVFRISVGGPCNNNCLFCPANTAWPRHSTEELARQVRAAVVVPDASIHFTDGELTAHPALRTILGILSRHKARWSMATNARVFVSARNADVLAEAGLVRCLVSIHGPGDLHDRLTRTTGFAQTMEGITNLLRAGVKVDLSCLVTKDLAGLAPDSVASVFNSTGAGAVTFRVPISHTSDQSAVAGIRPDLATLVAWVNQVAGLLDKSLEVKTRDIPVCALGFKPAESAEQLHPDAQWPCRHCELGLKGHCRGFVPQLWQPGDIDLLDPRSSTHPGHLTYRPAGRRLRFDLTNCPFRASQRALPGTTTDIMMSQDPEKGAELWTPQEPGLKPAPVLQAKVAFQQIWLQRTDTSPQPLALATQCASCHRLFECPAVAVPMLKEHFEKPIQETATQPASTQTKPGTLEGYVREIWLVDNGINRPRRPCPVEPAMWLANLRSNGLVPNATSLPSATRRIGLQLSVEERQTAPNHLVAQHHEGISLQVTESCMCRCVMCNIVGYFKRPVMPLTEILNTLEQARMLGMNLADLFGGEVTLRKDLAAMVEYVRWLNMKCMFITTGYYITPSYLNRLKKAGINRVVVSIDGSKPEIHDPIRQLPGLFDKAVEAMRLLAREPAIESFASTVILSQNLRDLPDLVRLSGSLGIHKHEFFLPISGPVSSTTARWPTKDEMHLLWSEVLPELERTAREHKVSIDFRPEIRTWSFPQEEATEMISQGLYNIHASDVKSRCKAPGFNVFVTVNGNVYPCDMPAVISHRTAIGNLGQDNLLAIVTSETMAEFVDKAGHHAACRMCVGRYEAVR